MMMNIAKIHGFGFSSYPDGLGTLACFHSEFILKL
jgi:hypothetical protein